jgi:YfiH family protein
MDADSLTAQLPPETCLVQAEQVHGSSAAVVGRGEPSRILAGCDALLTEVPGVALVVRTADCLPVFFADPQRPAVGLAHVGWRGVVGALLVRVVAAFRHAYQSPPEALRVAIGPGIRACCYDVGPEFAQWFGSSVQVRGNRRTCDLVGAAMEQLVRCGVPAQRIVDTGSCTACDTERWFSFRREGESTGRLRSLIMIPNR